MTTPSRLTAVPIAVAPGSEIANFIPPVVPGEPARKLNGGEEEYEAGFNADVEYSTPPVIGPPAPPLTPVAHCVVPSLSGKKLKAVRKALRRANCKLGTVTKKNGATGKTGRVRRQSPKPGRTMPAGAKVTITLKP